MRLGIQLSDHLEPKPTRIVPFLIWWLFYFLLLIVLQPYPKFYAGVLHIILPLVGKCKLSFKQRKVHFPMGVWQMFGGRGLPPCGSRGNYAQTGPVLHTQVSICNKCVVLIIMLS